MAARTLVLLFTLIQCTACVTVRSPLSDALPRLPVDRYRVEQYEARSVSGCRFHYRLFQPHVAITGTHVILGHGFLRGQGTLVALSRALANAGIPAVTLDFCNMRLWRGNHRLNAQAIRQVARELDVEDNMIAAGFSAGALAALLSAESQTRAVVTLDLVDQDGAGQEAARRLGAPLIGLYGPPHPCNANNQALSVFDTHAAANSEVTSLALFIPGASHCEFESPSNSLCEVVCGDGDSKQADSETRRAIIDTVLDRIQPFIDSPRGTTDPR